MKSTQTKNIEAILAICMGLLIVFWFTEIKGFLLGSIILGMTSLLSKRLAAFVARLWFALSEFLGMINSKVILSLLFFLILTPIALLYRLFKGDTLQLKKKKEGDSYFKERNHRFEKKDLEHPF